MLLRETDLSLEKIAIQCGFRHVEYMTVVFKRDLGQTPSDYRRQRRLRRLSGDQVSARTGAGT